MLSLHTRILTHQFMVKPQQNGGSSQRRGSAHSPPRMLCARGPGGDQNGGDMSGMEHDTSDVLEAEPRRKGGLMRSGNVSPGRAQCGRTS